LLTESSNILDAVVSLCLSVDTLIASDTGTPRCHTDGRSDDDVDEDSFEQLFEQLRVMKGSSFFFTTVHGPSSQKFWMSSSPQAI